MANLDLTDHFLIAMPSLADPNFHQTVTYVCAHNEEGAMGIVINRPMKIALGDVLTQMEMQAMDPVINSQTIFFGGPVQQDRGFIIYNPPSQWDSTIKVSDRLGVATSKDILEAISQGRGPTHNLVALGYAGWGAGQLEREIAENAWIAGPADESILFELPPEVRWFKAAELLGVDFRRMSSDVGHA